jgi:hypothetical protein
MRYVPAKGEKRARVLFWRALLHWKRVSLREGNIIADLKKVFLEEIKLADSNALAPKALIQQVQRDDKID